MTTPVSTLTVAAVQMQSTPGDVAGNLERAAEWAARAASRGARLVLFPELMPNGYRLDETLWRSAQPFDGTVLAWLRAQATRRRIWIGTSFVESDGRDFFNTFLLVDDEGRIAAKVRKNTPAAMEAQYFRGSRDAHVFDTALGRIAIGICYESLRGYWAREVANRCDFALLAVSAPTPTIDRHNTPADRRAFNALVGRWARGVAATLHCPVVLANQSGPWRTPLPWPFGPQDSTFPGGSAIVAGDGTPLAALGAEEGLLVSSLSVGRTCQASVGRGRWSTPVPWKFWLFVIPETLGAVRYRLSRRRRRIAEQTGPALAR